MGELLAMFMLSIFALGALFGMVGTLIYIRWSDARTGMFIRHYCKKNIRSEIERYCIHEG